MVSFDIDEMVSSKFLLLIKELEKISRYSYRSFFWLTEEIERMKQDEANAGV
jgi:hypothetical protein